MMRSYCRSARVGSSIARTGRLSVLGVIKAAHTSLAHWWLYLSTASRVIT